MELVITNILLMVGMVIVGDHPRVVFIVESDAPELKIFQAEGNKSMLYHLL